MIKGKTLSLAGSLAAMTMTPGSALAQSPLVATESSDSSAVDSEGISTIESLESFQSSSERAGEENEKLKDELKERVTTFKNKIDSASGRLEDPETEKEITDSAEELATFLLNVVQSGLMVSVDAAILLVILLPLIKDPALRRKIVNLTVAAHGIYGLLGLGSLSGGEATVFSSAVLWTSVTLGAWFSLEGHIENMQMPSSDEDSEEALEIKHSFENEKAYSAEIIAVLTAVSVDEYFAVMQKYQWMIAQGWDTKEQVLNVGLSMGVLWAVLSSVNKLADNPKVSEWVKKNRLVAMKIVFGIINYYIIRGVTQNQLGIEYTEIPYTGIAPTPAGIAAVTTLGFDQAFKNETFRAVTEKIISPVGAVVNGVGNACSWAINSTEEFFSKSEKGE